MNSLNKKLVSVIVPVYNTAKYLSACIDSILNQTHKNLEVILINDGSTDESSQICRKYLRDKRVKFIDRENRGLSQTRKQGIELVQGEYFCNLDSDDFWVSDFIEKMLTCAVKTNADIVACGRTDFDSIHKKDYYLTSMKQEYELDKNEVTENIHELHQELWLPDSWNKLYKTDFVRNTKVEYLLPNKYNGTDYLYNHLLILHCPKYAVLNEPLVKHRIVQGSRVHRKNKPLQEGFEFIIRTVYKEAQDLKYPERFYENYNYCYVSMLKMVFQAIITESDSITEAKGRFDTYYSRRRMFENELGIDLRQFNRTRKNRDSSLFYSAMTGNSRVLSQLIYLKSRIRTMLLQILYTHKQGRQNHDQ